MKLKFEKKTDLEIVIENFDHALFWALDKNAVLSTREFGSFAGTTWVADID